MADTNDREAFYAARNDRAHQRTQQTRKKAQDALQALLAEGYPISVAAVADRAGIARSALYTGTNKDILANIKKAMGEQPLRPLPNQRLQAGERDLRAQLLAMQDAVTNLSKENDILRSQLGAANLSAAANPDAQDLNSADAEIARITADLLDAYQEIDGLKQQLSEAQNDYAELNTRRKELIRDNTRLEQENLQLKRTRPAKKATD